MMKQRKMKQKKRQRKENNMHGLSKVREKDLSMEGVTDFSFDGVVFIGGQYGSMWRELLIFRLMVLCL